MFSVGSRKFSVGSSTFSAASRMFSVVMKTHSLHSIVLNLPLGYFRRDLISSGRSYIV